MDTRRPTSCKNLQVDFPISYDTFEKNTDMPKSAKAFISIFFKNAWANLKSGFPKNLIVALAIGLAYWLFNIFFLAYINDTCFFHDETSYLAYIFGGESKSAKGIPSGRLTWYYNFTFMLTLVFLIKSIIKRMIKKGFFAPAKDIIGIRKHYNAYMDCSQYEGARLLFIPMGIAFVLSYLIVNPFTILLLSIIMFLSFARGMESAITSFIFSFKVSKNLNKNPIDRKSVLEGDIALPIFGFAVGFLFYSLLIIIMWFLFDYSFIIRTIVSALFALAFLILGITNTMKNKAVKTSINALVFTAFSALTYKTVFADDGGWSESGRNLAGFLANPGSDIMGKAGLGGDAGATLGYMLDSLGGAFFDKFCPPGTSAFLGMASGNLSNNRGITHAAINTAFNNIPGLGDTINRMLGNIERGLGGGGTTGQGWSTGGSSPGSSGSANTGSGVDLSKYINKKKKNPLDD